MIRMAIDLGIFEVFSDAGSHGLSTEELTQKVKADQLMLRKYSVALIAFTGFSVC